MMDLGNRKIFDDGTVLCNDNAIVELLYSDKPITSVLATPSNDVELYNKTNRLLDTAFGEIDTATGPVYENVDWFSLWLTPEPYASIDVEQYCLSRCQNQAEIDRTTAEFVLFKERNMLPVLRHLIYMVDTWRERGIVWGVGRGSSVSSFVLHLIGINRINPMQWGLEITEFLK